MLLLLLLEGRFFLPCYISSRSHLLRFKQRVLVTFRPDCTCYVSSSLRSIRFAYVKSVSISLRGRGWPSSISRLLDTGGIEHQRLLKQLLEHFHQSTMSHVFLPFDSSQLSGMLLSHVLLLGRVRRHLASWWCSYEVLPPRVAGWFSSNPLLMFHCLPSSGGSLVIS